MIQEILTLIIVALAGVYTMFQLWLLFFPKKNNQLGCTGSCSSCSLKVNFDS